MYIKKSKKKTKKKKMKKGKIIKYILKYIKIFFLTIIADFILNWSLIKKIINLI